MRFTDKGNANEVTITATAKSNPTRVFHYAFKLSDWYINNGMIETTWSDAKAYCANKNTSLPTRLQLGGTAQQALEYNQRGTIGSLWSEWGNLRNFISNIPPPPRQHLLDI